jgi:phage repressor protein C with HTH and peptisase S24 domain
MDEEREEIRRYIAHLARQTGLSLSALAKRAGVASTTLTRFMNSDDVNHVLSTTTINKLRRLARMGVWPEAAEEDRPDAAENGGDAPVAEIPEYDVRPAAGDGSADPSDGIGHHQHLVVGTWSLPSSYLRAHAADPTAVCVVRVAGDSMEPDYPAGERLLVDTSHRVPSPDGVYVLWDGYGLILKRLGMVHGSNPRKIRVMSINPDYPAYEVLASEIQVNGRVIGRWQWR